MPKQRAVPRPKAEAKSKRIVADPLTTGSPLIGEPALGQVHGFRTGRRHDLVAAKLVVASPMIGGSTEDVAPAKKSMGPQSARVNELLQELRREGRVRDGMSIAKIHRIIIKHWLGRKPPGRDTVARQLRSRQD
jgi:hypothetical protein